ncbi:AraC family transcriptional regulator [Microbacterium resistens]|nr:AraC family transcriptional regulator [Microbacterium resistens]
MPLPLTAEAPRLVPLHGTIVPDGYLLTTRFLASPFIDEYDGCRQRPHAHPEHLIFWPQRGSASVEIDGRRWDLSPGHGVWVPSGTSHTVQRGPGTTLAAVHILVEAWHGPAGGVRPVLVNAALRELLSHLASTDMPSERRLRAQRVCMELVAEANRPRRVPDAPRDHRILPIAEAILRDPADDRSIEDWAVLTSQSTRTIARAFRADTGLTFTRWRTEVRMAAALDLLHTGTPVGVVARRVGYTTLSAFSAAFHRTVGRPPHVFLGRSGI